VSALACRTHARRRLDVATGLLLTPPRRLTLVTDPNDERRRNAAFVEVKSTAYQYQYEIGISTQYAAQTRAAQRQYGDSASLGNERFSQDRLHS